MRFFAVLSTVCAASIVACAPSRPAERATASGLLAGFSRGVSFGNALDAPREGEWGVVLSERHFAAAAAAGFDHVRLPVRFGAHAGSAAPFRIESAFLRRVDWAVDQALSHGLGVVVDFHHYDELTTDPDTHGSRFVALWTELASHYRDRPARVALELLNEPHDALTAPKWNALLADAVRAIRAVDPERLLIVDGPGWAAATALHELTLPPSDGRLVASFHCYEPLLFTHQGAEWMGPEYQTVGLVFPGPPPRPVEPVPAARSVDWVREWFHGYATAPAVDNPGGVGPIIAAFDRAQAFARGAHVPLYLGEFAAIDRAESPSRARWLRAVRTEAERRGIAWAYWDDGGRMRALDVERGTWLEPLRSALFE